MQNALTIQGHAPASRTLRAVNIRKVCVRAISLARRKSVTLAVISAAVTYAGVLLGSNPLTYSAALAALGAVGLANCGQKGGEL